MALLSKSLRHTLRFNSLSTDIRYVTKDLVVMDKQFLLIFRYVGKLFSTKSGIAHLANVATLLALGLGIYALAYPETVSTYLDRVANNTEKTAVSGQRTADNTGRLTEEIPYWLELSEVGSSSAGAINYQTHFKISNASNFQFSQVAITFDLLDGGKISIPVTTIAARESLKMNPGRLPSTVSAICITALSEKDGKRYYDFRRINITEYLFNIEGGRLYAVTFPERYFSDEPHLGQCE